MKYPYRRRGCWCWFFRCSHIARLDYVTHPDNGKNHQFPPAAYTLMNSAHKSKKTITTTRFACWDRMCALAAWERRTLSLWKREICEKSNTHTHTALLTRSFGVRYTSMVCLKRFAVLFHGHAWVWSAKFCCSNLGHPFDNGSTKDSVFDMNIYHLWQQ